VTEPEPAGGTFEAQVNAEVVGHAEHPADLTPEQRAHLGLPADEEQQEDQ